MFCIKEIVKSSIAGELGIKKGEYLVEINDKKISDVFDYRYEVYNEEVNILIYDGNEYILYEIEKEFEEDLGLVFMNDLMDDEKSCKNKCIFCFIDQLPPKMRDTMYFKDDDIRLSFLVGNYVTLTNIDNDELDRMINYHLSPINLSVHSTEDEVRLKMIRNPNSVGILGKIKKLIHNGIEVNGQIVLVKGYNDEEHLSKSLEDLLNLDKNLKSLSIVPVGLTKYRDGLEKLETFNKEESISIVKQVEGYQEKFLKKFGSRTVYISDEFYIKADICVPEAEYYEDYPQIENGVGLVRSFLDEFNSALQKYANKKIFRSISIATGLSFYNYLQKMIKDCDFDDKIKVYGISNHYFGETVTVTGLLTGEDLINSLKNKNLGRTLLLSSSMFKSDDNVTLDDFTVEALEEELGVEVKIIPNSGKKLVEYIYDITIEEESNWQNQ